MSVLLPLCLITSWSTNYTTRVQYPHPVLPTVITYNMSEFALAELTSRFSSDTFLSLSRVSTNSVRAAIRSGFARWGANSLVSFLETEGEADVTVRIGSGRKDKLAWVMPSRTGNTVLIVSEDKCWYPDASFCSTMRERAVEASLVLAFVWSLCIGCLLYVFWRPATTVVGATGRILLWSGVVAVPLFAVGCLPCVSCYDLERIISHEAGHVLLMGHSDEGRQFCGCGRDARECNSTAPGGGVMRAVFRHASQTCLSRDDVDGARTLWGGSCSDPVYCDEAASALGMHRVAVCLVYAFAASWSVVVLRNGLRKCDERTKIQP